MFDHQKVKLVAVTQPTDPEIGGAEALVAYCARVSNPANQTNDKTASRLLRYCINNKHFSIFEMVHVVMEIQTTRDIGRQIIRHRSFSFQEFSQRYAQVDDNSFVLREARKQDTKNRQNSIPITDADNDLAFQWEHAQNYILQNSRQYYEWAIKNGIAKEQARAILPEGMTMSRLYMAGSLRNWIHYVDVRNDPGVTQTEHVDIAAKAQKILIEQFPFLQDYWTQEKDAGESK